MNKTDHDILIAIHTQVKSINIHLEKLNGQVQKNTLARVATASLPEDVERNKRFRIQGYLIAGVLSSITIPLLIAQILRSFS